MVVVPGDKVSDSDSQWYVQSGNSSKGPNEFPISDGLYKAEIWANDQIMIEAKLLTIDEFFLNTGLFGRWQRY